MPRNTYQTGQPHGLRQVGGDESELEGALLVQLCP
jgi:hypothetical protein